MFEVEDDMSLTEEQRKRYYNSIFLKEIGEIGQEKLLLSKVAVVGAGGLASSSLLYMVSIGIGELTIIDDDVVRLENLPRQILFRNKDVNEKKVFAAKRNLLAINDQCIINVVDEKLTTDNASSLLKGHDVVLDCTDNFETKFLINDTCVKLNIPFVIAGVSDYQGQVCTCLPHKSKDFKSLFSSLPINIDEKYKSEDQGVFPPSVGVISDTATSDVVKLLLGIGDLLTNKMVVINLLTNTYKVIKFPD